MGQDDECPFCSIMFHLPAARALADGGDLAGAREHLEAAERSGARWRSRGWDAALLEARAHLVAAEGDEAAAEVMRRQAASLYGGEPFDAARCAV